MSNDSKKPTTVVDGLGALPPVPPIDFAMFGEVEERDLPKPQYFGGQFLARNWVTIPHVTHNDEADITDLEAYRKSFPVPEDGAKVSMPVLLVKAIVATLKKFPKFNASLDSTGRKIILKKYFHIGVAVDTPNGLLVPVLQNADQKNINTLSNELAELSTMARSKGLPMDKMIGGSFTLSSIGVLGGTSFTPIINAPEVAILGATKTFWKPERGENDEIVWRLKIPLSLSYDHRVINGADAARFLTHMAEIMPDPESFIR